MDSEGHLWVLPTGDALIEKDFRFRRVFKNDSEKVVYVSRPNLSGENLNYIVNDRFDGLVMRSGLQFGIAKWGRELLTLENRSSN